MLYTCMHVNVKLYTHKNSTDSIVIKIPIFRQGIIFNHYYPLRYSLHQNYLGFCILRLILHNLYSVHKRRTFSFRWPYLRYLIPVNTRLSSLYLCRLSASPTMFLPLRVACSLLPLNYCIYYPTQELNTCLSSSHCLF